MLLRHLQRGNTAPAADIMQGKIAATDLSGITKPKRAI
jgi:hypothetical protein